MQTTGRNQHDEVVLTYERKVQVWKHDVDAEVAKASHRAPRRSPASWCCRRTTPPRRTRRSPISATRDTYFEDFTVGDAIEHSRGRTMTSEHIALTAMLDNTSQVHCNQHMIDQNPERYVGGQLIIFGGIPFKLCLGLSCPDVADNSLGDIVYKTGRHSAPLFAGDTVFASTEITGKRDLPGRPDLGVLDTILRGHKFVRRDGACEKVEIFYLERALAVKRRSHYA